MESLIHVINKLQDVFAVIGEHEIDLPQIVVVGSQSSGKSSVLESLVGKSFLPRGTGIVTRVPLILQIIRYSHEDRENMLKRVKNENITEWAIFSHEPDNLYTDFDKVREEIEKRTDHLAGKNKGIANKPIVLKVFTTSYDLTFVDLPGITKIPVGEPTEDIEEQILEIIIKYIQQPNSIILAVVTANTDWSTSESLNIARKIDPEGKRTIAVVTKLDLIDKGTLQDTEDLLCGRKISVKLVGIIGVVNRSQEDINKNKSMEETMKSEKEFLRTHYPDIYKNHGNEVLASTLQKILISQIKNTLPNLYKNLFDTKARLEHELKTLQPPSDKASFLLGLLKDIDRSYSDTVLGNRLDVSDNTIMGGARIKEIINNEYIEKINEIDPLLDLSEKQVEIILSNTASIKNVTFVNDKALDIMIKRQLKHLINPALLCVELVWVEMLKIFDSIDQNILGILKRFPKINKDVRSVLNKILDEKLADTKEFCNSYIETYQKCIIMENPDVLFQLAESSSAAEIAYISSRMENLTLYSNDSNNIVMNNKQLCMQTFKQMLIGVNDFDKSLDSSKQVKMHLLLVRCYYKFARENIRDFISKRIIDIMVHSVLGDFEKRMHNSIAAPYLSNNSLDEVLDENSTIVEDKKNVKALLAAVEKGLKSMADIQCY